MARLLSRPVLAGIAVVAVIAGVLVSQAGGDDLTAADKAFVAVCEAHGGTATLAPGSGDYVKDARDCTIEYGGEDYEMYAVHPEGFSAREAAQARHACTLLARQKRAESARGDDVGSVRVVWHPRSAICESQP